jgi:Cu-processing system permease protein
MRAAAIIALREVREASRNRWILAVSLLLGGLALILAFLGSAPAGTVGAAPLSVTVVSLSSLSIYLIPLIALLLAFDAVVGEAERGTLLLLLAYPVSRGAVIVGKFGGHLAVLALAITLGFGVALGGLAGLRGGASAEAVEAFGLLIASSILLGAVFLALGTLISSIARSRATAIGLAIAAWLFFVLLYDMGLLGLLVADGGRTLDTASVKALLLLNPTDVYRLLNLAGVESVRNASGLAGLSDEASIGTGVLLGALAAWIVVPLAAASLIFRRRQI